MILGLIPTLIGIPVSDNTALTPGANVTLVSPGSCTKSQGASVPLWTGGAHPNTQAVGHSCGDKEDGELVTYCSGNGQCVDDACICAAAGDSACDSLAGSGNNPPASKWGNRYCFNYVGTASTYDDLVEFDKTHAGTGNPALVFGKKMQKV